MILCAAAGLAGCIPNKYDNKIRDGIEERGKAVLEEYVKSLPAAEEIVSCQMCTGSQAGESVYSGFYLTNVVSCTFRVGEKTKEAMVDLETGQIWTDYYMYDVNEAVKKQLIPYFERAGISGDFTVSGAALCGCIISHDMETIHQGGEKVDTVVRFTNMLPSDVIEPDKDKWAELVLKDAELSGFEIRMDMDGNGRPPADVLYEYIKESGNYIRPGGKFYDVSSDYRMSYKVREDPSVNNWSVTLTMAGSPEEMTFSISRGDRKTIDGMTFCYTGGSLSGDYPGDWDAPLYEYDCPVTVGDGIMSFYGPDPYGAALYFEEEPEYKEFTRITYSGGKPDEPEKLSVRKLEDGRYSLYDGRKINEDGYVFSYEQDIKFQ